MLRRIPKIRDHKSLIKVFSIVESGRSSNFNILRDKLLIALNYYYLISIEEMLSLKWCNIDFKENNIIFNEDDFITINIEVLDLFKQLYSEMKKLAFLMDYIFCSSNSNTPINSNTILRDMSNYLRKAGISNEDLQTEKEFHELSIRKLASRLQVLENRIIALEKSPNLKK